MKYLYTYTYLKHSECSDEFQKGIEHFERDELEAAAFGFELAYESVKRGDIFNKRYASFCGLLRLLLGDHGGLILCRDAVRSEKRDADLFLNLARAEWFYRNRRKTVEAIFMGLDIDSNHPGLTKLHQELGVRKSKPLALLDRSNPLNVMIGRILRKKKSPISTLPSSPVAMKKVSQVGMPL